MANDINPLGDEYDRVARALRGLPDVVNTKPSTVTVLSPVLELAQTWIIETVRQTEKGDTIFLQYLGSSGSVRIVVPPAVADLIARQRDALATKNRRKGARKAYENRVAAGEDPAENLRRKAKPRRSKP